MEPTYHAGFGFLFASAVYTLFPDIGFFGFFSIFLFSVIGDIDHYIIYVKQTKNFNIDKAYDYFLNESHLKMKGKKVMPSFTFHAVELMVLFLVLGFFIKFFLYVALGLIFHAILDYVEMSQTNKMHTKDFSIIKTYWKRK